MYIYRAVLSVQTRQQQDKRETVQLCIVNSCIFYKVLFEILDINRYIYIYISLCSWVP